MNLPTTLYAPFFRDSPTSPWKPLKTRYYAAIGPAKAAITRQFYDPGNTHHHDWPEVTVKTFKVIEETQPCGNPTSNSKPSQKSQG